MLAKQVTDLWIYSKSLELGRVLFGLVDRIYQKDRIAEINQILRSSNSISSNIAEGFSNRFYSKKFILYLNIALGSSDEAQNHLRILINKNYISSQQGLDILRDYKNLSVRILNFINYIKKKNGI